MLCCARKKEGRDPTPDIATSPRRQQQNAGNTIQRPKDPPPMVVQGDFRKVSGISNEIFRQIETVENDHDATTAAALEAVERRGEMVVRLLEPRHMGRQAAEAVKRFLSLQDNKHTVHLVEIVKRPGQTLGLYIREGNGMERSDGVFISRIALESAVYNSGCLKVGDEILAVNLVDVTRMSLDDVVIIMSIPRRLVLVTRQTKGGAAPQQLHQLQQAQHKPPPVVVIKKELREDDDRNGGGGGGGLLMDELADARVREERRRRAAANAAQGMPSNREMSGSRSRLALGSLSRLGSHQDLHDGMTDPSAHNGLGLADLYYNSRPADRDRGGAGPGGGPGGGGMSSGWSYQPPPPVYSDQSKSGTPQHFQPYDRAYPKTLESLAEKVHSFYPGSNINIHAAQRRGSQQHCQTQSRTKLMPRSGSDQHLPRIEYQYAPPPRAAHTMLRSGMKSSLSHYGSRYSQQQGGYNSAMTSSISTGSSSRRHRPPLDYSSDTEATCSSSPRSFYCRHALGHGTGAASTLSRLTASPLTRGGSLRSNSLPRDHRGRPMVPPSPATARHAQQQGVRFDRDSSARSTTGSLDQYDSDGALSAPELPIRRERGRLPSSPSVFTADEYCAWLQRTPSTSAIYERIRASRDALAQQRASRLTFSAENLNLLERTREHDHAYGGYRTPLTGTLDRQSFTTGRTSASSGLSGASRSQSLRRMRQLLELEARHSPNSAAAAALRTPTSVVPESTRGRIMEINPSEFLKYKMDKGPSATTAAAAAAAAAAALGEPAGVSGLLWVHLLAGRGLRPSGGSSAATTPSTPSGPSAIGSSPLRDLYCVLECDRVHKARTVVRTGDLVFDWDETFELDLVANRELDFLIYSWDPQYRHKLCYKGSVHLASLLRQSPIHQLALKIEPRGTLYLRLRHTDPHQTFARRSASLSHPLLSRAGPKGLGSTGLLFGVDLETVVSRESLSGGVPGGVATALASQGTNAVPLIVRRCVEEVERRGLDIIGLYRLCGSATKKRILREAFERNARTVDLSPDNVPDINVITGVLKDYLRELPEPLFTKCLYQMMLDALTVCLPDDPEGNAKLMFSILDCLPKVNRATLIYLLDHLALVVSQSERNKMNPQNLAVCFGPIMMLQTEEGRELDFNQTIGVLRYLLEIWPCKSVREVLSAAHQSPSQKPPALPTLPAKPAGLLTSLSRVQSSSPVVVSSPISEDSSASPSPPEEAEILRNLPTSVGTSGTASGPIGSGITVTAGAGMIGKRGPPPRVEPRRNAGKQQIPGSAQTLPRQVGSSQGSPLPLPPRGSATLQRKWSNGENGNTNGINRPLPTPPGRVVGGHVMEAIKNIEMQQHQQEAQREGSGSGSAASSPRESRNGQSPGSGSMALTALSAPGAGERDVSPAASDQIETPTSSTGTEDSRREGGEHGADGDEEASDEDDDDDDDRFRSGRGSSTSVVMRDVRQE